MKDNEKKFIGDLHKMNNPKIGEKTINQLTSRELVITITNAECNSTALIEVAGTPPKSRILVGLSSEDDLFLIDKKLVSPCTKKGSKLKEMVLNFLKNNSYI